jgi:undecaprenyl-diphosphatase
MHMEPWQAIFLGALQGIAELFPISSLAQTILIPALLGWKLNQKDSNFLAFVVALHLATALALLIYFWKDWLRVMRAFAGCLTRGKLVYDRESKFAWMLVAGTVVVGLVGLLLEKKLRSFFEDASMTWIVGVILVVNGFVMLLADFLKLRLAPKMPTETEHAPDLAMHAALVGRPVTLKSASVGQAPAPMRKMAEDLTFTEATTVGAAQTLALLPGISRSGVTIIGGLFAGLSYEESSRFAFMLATPVIALAALKKVPDLFKPEAKSILILAIYGSIVAFIAAYLSVKFLMKYFHNNRLSPFGYFCIVFGLGAAIYLKYQPSNNQPPNNDLAQQVGINSGGQVVQQDAPTSR